MNLYVDFYKMIPRKSVIIIFFISHEYFSISEFIWWTRSVSRNVLIVHAGGAVLVIKMPSGKGHTLKSFSASFYKSFMAFVIHLNNKRLLET